MSTADELAKLDALRQSGVLTQEEFEREKERLLWEPGNSEAAAPGLTARRNHDSAFDQSFDARAWRCAAPGACSFSQQQLGWLRAARLGSDGRR